MHFEDFDVEILIQRLRNPLDEGRQQVDAHAHVAGFDDHGAFGRLGDQRFAFARKAGGADDVGAARARRMFGEGNGRGGDGEIERRVGFKAGTGSFYRHFNSKEELLEAAVEREVSRCVAHIEEEASERWPGTRVEATLSRIAANRSARWLSVLPPAPSFR